MKLNALLGELGEKIKLNDLELDKNRMCRLIFDDKFVVDIEALPDEQTFFMYGVVGRVPTEEKEAFYEKLLEGNLFGKETGDASLGVDPQQGEVILFQKLNAEKLEYIEFEKHLEQFLNYMEFWSKELAPGAFSTDGETGDRPGFAADDGFNTMRNGIIRG